MADKIKKLSDAIKLGSTFRPQCKDTFFKDGASCAIGAAIEAVGIPPTFDRKLFAKTINERWPEVKEMCFCPECGEGHDSATTSCSVYATIAVLNNEHGWTRERIADWLTSKGY